MSLELPPWPPKWREIDDAVSESVRSGDWGRYGSEACGRLRERLGRLFHDSLAASATTRESPQPHVRLCCSGTAAMEIALRAAGVGAGDEVILAAFDYPGNFRSVELVGGRPVLVDVATQATTLNPIQLEAAASDHVRAVIVSHLYGQAADVVAIADVCEQRGWILIEDACQVPGMQIDDRPAGSFGHLGTVSFGGSKPLTSGSGGALLTRDARIAGRFGPWIDRPSDAFPLSPLQAAVLLPQIDRLEQLNRRRTETVRFLQQQWRERMPNWQPLFQDATPPANVQPAHYKLGWTVDSREQRSRVVHLAKPLGLPVGPGFRSMDKVNERRCRKPLPLIESARLGERVCILDHTALLVEPQHRDELLTLLARLHDQSL